MRLAIVPTETHDIGGQTARRPVLPPSVRDVGSKWGQAGSHPGFRRRGRQLLWLDVTSAEADAIAGMPNVTMLGRAAPDSETTRLRLALSSEPAPRVGARWSARDEFVDAYRGIALAAEKAEGRREAFVRLGRIAAMVGLPVLLSLLLRGWCPEWLHGVGGPAWALVVLHADTFNRSNGTLNGATMSDGIGAWTNIDNTNNPGVFSNGCGNNAGWSYLKSYDSVMSAVDEQRVTATSLVSVGAATYPTFGPMSRWDGTGGYFALVNPGGTGTYVLYELPGFSSLGSGSSCPTNGDTFGVDSSGSNHTLLKNGTGVGGPFTDSTMATGRAGLVVNDLGVFQSNPAMDDWQVEVASTTSVKTWDGLANASVKTIDGLARASVKTWNGLA